MSGAVGRPDHVPAVSAATVPAGVPQPGDWPAQGPTILLVVGAAPECEHPDASIAAVSDATTARKRMVMSGADPLRLASSWARYSGANALIE